MMSVCTPISIFLLNIIASVTWKPSTDVQWIFVIKHLRQYSKESITAMAFKLSIKRKAICLTTTIFHVYMNIHSHIRNYSKAILASKWGAIPNREKDQKPRIMLLVFFHYQDSRIVIS